MKLESEVVEFRDGTKLTVTEASWEADMRVARMEDDAEKRVKELIATRGPELTENDFGWIAFVQSIYPKLAACSTGAVPSEDETYHMATVEREKWAQVAHRLNPTWFKGLDALIAERKLSEADLKKKEMMLTESTTD